MKTDGGGWTVFQRRMDGTVDFYRNWKDYLEGFGELDGEFWLGLNKIHRLTEITSSLRIDMQDFLGIKRYAKYSVFKVNDSDTQYSLKVGGFSGNTGDSFSYHSGQKFFTKDKNTVANQCATSYKGAWWYKKCHLSNLNGLYLSGSHSSYANGINWQRWKGYKYSLKFTEMKVKAN